VDINLILLVLTGLFAGLVGGLLGIGGSIVMIPAMTELFGPNQHLYQAAAMIVNFFVVVPAAYQHFRAGAIHADLIRRLLPLATVAVVMGVLISEHPWFVGEGEARLRALFGLFLMSMCVYDIYRAFRPERTSERDRSLAGWGFAAAVAVPTGLVAGLLGVGGGIMAVPLQRRLLGVPLRAAIANSATLIIATSLVGAAMKNYALIAYHDHPPLESFKLAAVLIPTAIIGASIGSLGTHRLPRRAVHVAFFVLLLIVSLRLTYSAVKDMPRSAKARPAASARVALPLCRLGLGRRVATNQSQLFGASAPIAQPDQRAGCETGFSHQRGNRIKEASHGTTCETTQKPQRRWNCTGVGGDRRFGMLRIHGRIP